ncbi:MULTISPECIES: GNAT family N-acetyltransferase [Streptococcus]|uniref:GNAT family N-acetyltransferase n=2 Tax=Streptococcus TaxID=1301 RepID=A0ABW0UG57_9STRE|nr:GNAT family N-acetyltransferase [Streptococcus sp. S784/96/1]
MISYQKFNYKNLEEVKTLYKEANWTSYLSDDEKLARAFKNSLWILGAFDNDQLIGFVRCVGDGEHILLVQDLIVATAYQRQGIGTTLLKQVWKTFSHVRMIQLNTDLYDEKANNF